MKLFPPGKFGVIYADPPWTFTTRSPKGEGRSASQHYSVMSIDDIKKLPVASIAADDAVLFLWVPKPHLRLGLDTIAAWGFTYKTIAFTWVKLDSKGEPSVGLGFWTRANPEICLLATRGRPLRLAKNVPELILAPRGRHSAKPSEIRDRIERLVGGPYIELFARERAPNWVSWGDQLDA